MSKKQKTILTISSITLTLVLTLGGIWYVHDRQRIEPVSDYDTTVLAQNESGITHVSPSTDLQTEVTEIASSIAEILTATEAPEFPSEISIETTESPAVPEVVASESARQEDIVAKATKQFPVKTAETQKKESPVTKKDPVVTSETTTKKEEPPQTESDNPSRDEEVIPKQPAKSNNEKTSSTPMKSGEPTKESSNKANKKSDEDRTTKPSVTDSPTTDPPATKTTEKVTEKPTEAVTEKSTEAPKCKHNWVWKTHIETKTIPAKTHDVPVYDDGWDEAVTVRKIYCSSCKNIYDDLDDYYEHDFCFGSFGHMTVIDHYIHHEPELLFIDTIVDEPERKETVTVNDYQYCSLCGEHK